MKKTVTMLALAMLFTLLVGCASTPPVNEPPYQQIFEIPGKDKATLYSVSLQWIAKSFRSAQKVIQVSDKDSGMIVCRGSLPGSVLSLLAESVDFLMNIEVKDGKARMSFSDVSSTVNFENASSKAILSPQDKRLKASFDGIFADYQKYLTEQNGDW